MVGAICHTFQQEDTTTIKLNLMKRIGEVQHSQRKNMTTLWCNGGKMLVQCLLKYIFSDQPQMRFNFSEPLGKSCTLETFAGGATTVLLVNPTRLWCFY